MSEHRHTEVCRKEVKIQMIPNCKNEKANEQNTSKVHVCTMFPSKGLQSCTSGKICRQLKFLEEQGCL